MIDLNWIDLKKLISTIQFRKTFSIYSHIYFPFQINYPCTFYVDFNKRINKYLISICLIHQNRLPLLSRYCRPHTIIHLDTNQINFGLFNSFQLLTQSPSNFIIILLSYRFFLWPAAFANPKLNYSQKTK